MTAFPAARPAKTPAMIAGGSARHSYTTSRDVTVERSHPVEADAMLWRDAVASDEADCPECTPPIATAAAQTEAGRVKGASGTALLCAAISIHDRRMMVNASSLDRRPDAMRCSLTHYQPTACNTSVRPSLIHRRCLPA